MKKSAAAFEKQVDAAFKKLIESKNFFPAWANRELMPMYSDMQLRRWRTENAAFTSKWNPLSKDYARIKLRKFASDPGRGKKLLIGTGRLLAGVIPPEARSQLSIRGPQEEFRKIVTDKSIKVMTAVPYAKYVDKEREFTSIPKDVRKGWAKSYLKYVVAGVRK